MKTLNQEKVNTNPFFTIITGVMEEFNYGTEFLESEMSPYLGIVPEFEKDPVEYIKTKYAKDMVDRINHYLKVLCDKDYDSEEFKLKVSEITKSVKDCFVFNDTCKENLLLETIEDNEELSKIIEYVFDNIISSNEVVEEDNHYYEELVDNCENKDQLIQTIVNMFAEQKGSELSKDLIDDIFNYYKDYSFDNLKQIIKTDTLNAFVNLTDYLLEFSASFRNLIMEIYEDFEDKSSLSEFIYKNRDKGAEKLEKLIDAFIKIHKNKTNDEQLRPNLSQRLEMVRNVEN